MLICPTCKKQTDHGSYCKHCGTILNVENCDEDDELIEEFLVLDLLDEELFE
jgi:hypothetical protein